MKLVLHVGLPKTGTTALQATLSQNQEVLLRDGYFYPRLSTGWDHNVLSVPFLQRLPRVYRGAFKSQQSARAAAYRAWGRLGRTVSDVPAHTLVISGEYFWRITAHQRFRTHLKEFLPGVTNINVVAYLRRPSDYYLSMLQQGLHASSRVRRVRREQYSPPLKSFARAGQLLLREFSPGALEHGDIVDDFMEHALHSGVPLVRRGVRRNASLSAEAMVILQEYRRSIYPAEEHRMTLQSDHLVHTLRDVDSELKMPRPQLQPEVAAYLDQPHEDDVQLKRCFGFEFRSPTSTREAPFVAEPAQLATLVEVVVVDPERLQVLRATLLHRLLCRETRWGRSRLAEAVRTFRLRCGR